MDGLKSAQHPCSHRGIRHLMRAMMNTDDTQDRLTDLEVKASFTEDLLDELNQLVARQQQQIDALKKIREKMDR